MHVVAGSHDKYPKMSAQTNVNNHITIVEI